MRFTLRGFGRLAEVTFITMPRLDQSVIREIHTRIDIATYIGQYVSLKKRGRDLVGLCPFHGEKTPSFHVHQEEGYFKCFGCGAGGDVIAFAMKLENLPFGDAARLLANKAGIALESEDPRAARRRNEREAIYEANAIAAAYFERMLRGTAGAAARAYCEKRGFGEATVERFHLGYAPDSWEGLTDELNAHGVDLGLAEKAGLVKPSQRGGYYDFYRNRLMVPTYATTGEVIAFGGRELGNGEPKYLNTSTTPVYTKGEHLFALNIARRTAQVDRTLIVVEGYLDCIALHQAGFEGAVAALGTSFTERQASELRKYAENIFLCFDADAAGSSAATKAVDIASKVIEHTGSSVRVVALPHGDDPDSFVRKHGAAGFRALLDAAKPSIEFKLDPQIDRLRSGFDSPAAIARKAEALIRELTSREEWDRWRVYVAGRLKVNVDDLRNSRFLANSANFSPRSDRASATGSRHAPVNGRFGALEPLSFERDVLGIAVEDPALVLEYASRISPERFRNEVYRRTYQLLLAHAPQLRTAADALAACEDDDEARDLLASLGQRDRSATVRYGDSDERRAHLDRIVERLTHEDEASRYAELSRAIDEMYESGKSVPGELMGEFERLKLKLKK
jgi:DNA primase